MEERTETASETAPNGSATGEANAEVVSKRVVKHTKLKSFSAAKRQVEEIVKELLAVKTKAFDYQTVIVTKSQHIQDAQEHADRVRASLDRELTSAKQLTTETEGAKTRAQTATDDITKLLTDARTTKGTIETNAEDVVALLAEAEESAEKTKALAEKSATTETRIAEYEQRLAELEGQSVEQLKAIESLLPMATATGLAHAFDERRKTFLAPRQKWENLFIGSVIALVVLAAYSFIERQSLGTLTLDQALLYWLFRLPVAGALVWLAIHAGHEAALAKQLEEDYGFKSAAASVFLGFNKQMTEVGSEAATNEPLATLCENTLSIIANPPGRIYEKNKLTASLTDKVSGLSQTVKELVAKTGLTENK